MAPPPPPPHPAIRMALKNVVKRSLRVFVFDILFPLKRSFRQNKVIIHDYIIYARAIFVAVWKWEKKHPVAKTVGNYGE